MKKKSRMIFIGILLVTGVLGLTLVSFAETVTYTYDNLGRLIQVDYGNGVIIKYEYDKAGNRQKAYTPPVANFTVPSTTGNFPYTICFTDTSSYDPISWLWDFGDGTTSTLRNPCHTYRAPGTYTVTLTVSNLGGPDTETRTNYIIIQICPNLPVRIAGASPTYYSTLQAAYDAAVNGNTIESQAIRFIGNLSANRNISITLEGGYDCIYTGNNLSETLLKGMITTGSGTVTIENFILEQ